MVASLLKSKGSDWRGLVGVSRLGGCGRTYDLQLALSAAEANRLLQRRVESLDFRVDGHIYHIDGKESVIN